MMSQTSRAHLASNVESLSYLVMLDSLEFRLGGPNGPTRVLEYCSAGLQM